MYLYESDCSIACACRRRDWIYHMHPPRNVMVHSRAHAGLPCLFPGCTIHMPCLPLPSGYIPLPLLLYSALTYTNQSATLPSSPPLPYSPSIISDLAPSSYPRTKLLPAHSLQYTPAWQLRPAIPIITSLIVSCETHHHSSPTYSRHYGHEKACRAAGLYLAGKQLLPRSQRFKPTLPCDSHRQQQDPRQHKQHILPQSRHIARL